MSVSESGGRRLLSLVGNPALRELHKAAFSGIANEFGLRIRVLEGGLETVHGGAFRSAVALGEGKEGKDWALGLHSADT